MAGIATTTTEASSPAMNIAEATISPISRDRLRDLRAALDEEARAPAPLDSVLVSILNLRCARARTGKALCQGNEGRERRVWHSSRGPPQYTAGLRGSAWPKAHSQAR